jgi:hypothetical protein
VRPDRFVHRRVPTIEPAGRRDGGVRPPVLGSRVRHPSSSSWFFCLERHTIRRTATIIRRLPLHRHAAARRPAPRASRSARASRITRASRRSHAPVKSPGMPAPARHRCATHGARTARLLDRALTATTGHEAPTARGARTRRVQRPTRGRPTRGRATGRTRRRAPPATATSQVLRRRRPLLRQVAVARVGGDAGAGATRRSSSPRTRRGAPHMPTRAPGCSTSTARSAPTARASSPRRR